VRPVLPTVLDRVEWHGARACAALPVVSAWAVAGQFSVRGGLGGGQVGERAGLIQQLPA
jgi:hypothetical protein